MLINKWNWRDAGILYETDAGGSGGDNENSNGNEPGGEMSPEQLKAELERTREALKKANREAGDRRKKLDEIEAAEAKRKEAELSEAQKAAQRAEKAEADYKALQERHRLTAIRSAVRLAAKDAGFVDPEDAVQLADLSGVTLGEDDKVSGADEAVKALAKAKPHLTTPTRPLVSNINATPGGQARPLTPAELVAQRRESDSMYTPF